MGDRLKGKVAIVTGSGRGIGRGEALALASEGAKVVINDLGVARDGSGTSASPAEEVVAEIKKMGGEAVANYESVSTWASAEKIVKAAIDTFGRLDILVNNAGFLRDRMVFNMAEEDWDIIMKVHLYGHFFMIRHAVPIFRQQRSGRIINTSSVAGLGTTFGQANYGAAKEGIVGLTRQVARDMVRYGVTCNAIRPNAGTRMTLNDELIAAWKKAGMEMAADALRAAKPEDIAPLIVWLASDASAHVTGRTFYVQTGTIALFTEPEQIKTVNKDGSWTIDEVFKLMPEVTAGLSA
jgi:NAD(P)-dependent dehydrogenase (short-subunit alcohol dehydrogenase family)